MAGGRSGGSEGCDQVGEAIEALTRSGDQLRLGFPGLAREGCDGFAVECIGEG
jgi:hypothetical protein